MVSEICATLKAAIISSSVASFLPQRILEATLPENKKFFCKTTETESLNVLRSYSLTSLPPTKTCPSVVSYNLEIKLTKVDLPLPVEPIIPINSPDLILMFKLLTA